MISADRARERLRDVTREEPCPVCGGNHKCRRGDRGLLICGRQTGEQPGFVFMGQSQGDTQWSSYRREGDPALGDDRPPQRHKPSANGHHRHTAGYSPPAAAVEVDLSWDERMRTQERALTSELRTELAQLLGIPEAALAALRIGYLPNDPEGPCRTFAEHNAHEHVLGISRRFRDGRKKFLHGGKRGLTLPSGWRDREGPVCLPEGASDVLAFTALGLAAIGRPLNTGGVELLADLLHDVPPDRPIIVVAEYDPKPDGKWPGRDGAVKVATELQQKLNRPVQWVLPPAGAKDVRKWVQAQSPDATCADEWQDLGQRLLREWEGKSQKIAERQAETDFGAFRFKVISSKDFAVADYRPEWLVRRVLVKGQPGVMGGPLKCLKTSLTVDLFVSLSSATPFLGHFPIYRRVRAVILSGESGQFTLQDCARRVCAARGIDLADCDLHWGFRLPKLANRLDLAELKTGLMDCGAEVVALDPLYLSLLNGGDTDASAASNLYATGPLLLAVAEACLDVGATPLICHHFRRTVPSPPAKPELSWLSHSGVSEFARQWLLLSRREEYDPDNGLHQLWLQAGGSAGHSGLYALDVDEGRLADDFTGRTWQVTVQGSGEARETTLNAKEAEKARRQAEQDRRDDAAFLVALDRLDKDRQGVGVRKVREAAGLSGSRATRTSIRLVDAEVIEEIELEVSIGSSAKRQVEGVRRRPENDA